MDDPAFIMVVGMPRGGTSIVAKMLIELGVNMGESFVNSAHYPSYEDAGFHKAVANWSAWGVEHLREKCVVRVREYMLDRVAQVAGPVGAKFPCLSNLYGAQGWDALPMRLIHVVRPLEEVIESDLTNYTGRRRDRSVRVERAAELARIWWSQQRFVEHYGPIWMVRHGVDDSAHTVDGLALALGIETDAQNNEAITERVLEDPSKWRVTV